MGCIKAVTQADDDSLAITITAKVCCSSYYCVVCCSTPKKV